MVLRGGIKQPALTANFTVCHRVETNTTGWKRSRLPTGRIKKKTTQPGLNVDAQQFAASGASCSNDAHLIPAATRRCFLQATLHETLALKVLSLSGTK